MRKLAVVVLFLLVTFASPVLAGIGKGNGELGFDAGWTNFDATISDKTAGRVAFRGGYHFTRLFQLEGQLGCMAADDHSLGPDATVALCAMMVDGVFNFHSKSGNIVPYVLAGAGNATLVYDNTFAGKIDDSGMAYQGAAGGRFFFGKNKRTAVRLEISDLFADVFDQNTSNGSFTWGFTWRLGPAH